MEKIRSALTTRLTSAPLIVPLDKMAVPNKQFTPPATGVWIDVDFIPATSNPTTLGTGGKDTESGFFQVIICAPTDTGEAEAIKGIKAMKAKFFAGQQLQFSNRVVTVDRVQVSASYLHANYWKTPVVVHWHAKISRPTS